MKRASVYGRVREGRRRGKNKRKRLKAYLKTGGEGTIDHSTQNHNMAYTVVNICER